MENRRPKYRNQWYLCSYYLIYSLPELGPPMVDLAGRREVCPLAGSILSGTQGLGRKLRSGGGGLPVVAVTPGRLRKLSLWSISIRKRGPCVWACHLWQ